MTISNSPSETDDTPAQLAREHYTPVEDRVDAVHDQVFREAVLGDAIPEPTPVAALGEVVVGGWHDAAAAHTFHKAHKLAGAKAIAIVRCDQAGHLHIDDYMDDKGLKGAVIGGAIGGAIGLLFGPLAIATGALGAALGGLVNRIHDGGFNDDKLKELGETLGANTSAYIAVIEPEHADAAKDALLDQGARVSHNLSAETLALLASLDD